MNLKPVTLYTDGSCLKNGQEHASGGWAAILSWKDKERSICGGCVDGPTNNRMELTAVIEGMKLLKAPCVVTVVTDSKYVCDRIGKLQELHDRAWLNKAGAAIVNSDLLMQLLGVTTSGKHELRFQYVKGHAGHPMNELCDVLARDQAKKFQVID